MPIVDVELVCQTEAQFCAVSASALADALGAALGSVAGRTWVRKRYLSCNDYAENQVSVVDKTASDLPVFVTVLLSHPPTGSEREVEVKTITAVVAACVSRSPNCVHVQYAPAAAGRQAFGGRLVQ